LFRRCEKRLCEIGRSNIGIPPYLLVIDSDTGIEPRCQGAAGSQGKANEMTEFTREIATRYPTHEEVDAIVREARRLRAQAMRDGAISLWSMLQRVVAVKPTPAKTTHA